MKKLALALAVLVASALVARADEAKLPFNPYEKAQKGDWCMLTGTFKRTGAGEKKGAAQTFAKVSAVDDGQVTIREIAKADGTDKSSRKLSTKEAPGVAAYFDLKEGEVTDVKVEDETRTICGKELACKKLTFTWKHAPATDHVTAWLSQDVKAGGLAAFTMKGKTEANGVELETRITLECQGWGNGDKADAGETPDGILDPDVAGEATSEACDLPINPFTNAKKGDWTALKVEVSMGEHHDKAVLHFEESKVTKETVHLDAGARRQGDDKERTKAIEFDRTVTPSALDFLGVLVKGDKRSLSTNPTVTNVKVTDDKKTVGEKTFDCKKLSFTLAENSEKLKVKMWFSTEVKGIGVVAAEVHGSVGVGELSLEMELGGYGDADTTIFGKTADELSKKKGKKSDDDE